MDDVCMNIIESIITNKIESQVGPRSLLVSDSAYVIASHATLGYLDPWQETLPRFPKVEIWHQKHCWAESVSTIESFEAEL